MPTLAAACLACLLATTAPAQAPATGDLLVFTAAVDIGLDGVELGGICVMRPDGSDFRRLTSFSTVGLVWEPHSFDLPDDHADLSPDGRKIAFARRDGFQEWELYLMDVNGSNQPGLTSSPGLDIEPVFSPDGSKLAFGDAFGAALAAGNISGDFARDLVIGVPGEGVGGANAAGVVYVVPGAANSSLVVAAAVQRTASALPAPFTGPVAGARFGEVLALGDFNRDIFQIEDVVVGVPR